MFQHILSAYRRLAKQTTKSGRSAKLDVVILEQRATPCVGVAQRQLLQAGGGRRRDKRCGSQRDR